MIEWYGAMNRIPSLTSLGIVLCTTCVTPVALHAAPPVVGLRSPQGDWAVLYFVAGGRAHAISDALRGVRQTQWLNPRTGQWSSAPPEEK